MNTHATYSSGLYTVPASAVLQGSDTAPYYVVGHVQRHWWQHTTGLLSITLALISIVIATVTVSVMRMTSASAPAPYVAPAASAVNPEPAPVAAALVYEAVAAPEKVVELQPVIDKWVAAHPKQKWGIVVKSLGGSEFVARSGDTKTFDSASMYKLLLTLPLFKQVPLEKQKSIQINAGGTQRSITTCVDMMLRLSNNECGEAVGQYLNWTKAQKTLHQAGFTGTMFSKDDLKTTPADTALFLEKLHGNLFDATTREAIMKSLRDQRWRSGIPAGCQGCTTFNKTGQFGKVTHDAAIIENQTGAYVLVVFSENGTFPQIAELTKQIHTTVTSN